MGRNPYRASKRSHDIIRRALPAAGPQRVAIHDMRGAGDRRRARDRQMGKHADNDVRLPYGLAPS